MRRLREVWNDPKMWRLTAGDSPGCGVCGCIVAEAAFWGIVWVLYTAFIR